ncbi:DNA cytosine methyltransferase [Streptomyces sp. NRRL F-5126]|uniref:DNA cytosine methyltransferase n=1 Tax=Streptomyces sp. NRRL F-5126 TaxID=1463857 RepID=UPI000563E89E|nr:DNA cytosine methyltransferase [Streptomyces sp. NRRL F-5126]
MSDSFKIVDLFAGPGGFDVAARNLGVPVVEGIEWDEDACATRRAAGLPTRRADVRGFGPEDYPEANVLVGGPPCQTFTVAGNGEGRAALDAVTKFADRYADVRIIEDFASIGEELKHLSDERTGLVLEPLRWALEALLLGRPYQAVVLEQVPAVLPVWKVFARILSEKGYEVAEPAVLRTEEYGVPQTRRRAIMIARWAGAGAALEGKPRLPEPTHRHFSRSDGRDAGEPALRQWVTMGEVLDRRGPYEVVSNYGTGGDPKARGRRRYDQPSATVTGKGSRNKLEWGGRKLGEFDLPELGQLQTFPADYPWRRRNGDNATAPGTRSVIAQQIGNAVPPRFGMHVLAAALGLGDRLEDGLARLPSWRRTERSEKE